MSEAEGTVPPEQPRETSEASKFAAQLEREFDKESDRACIIVAATMIDGALENLLRARLTPSASPQDSLLEGANAPISTLSARIDLAHRIGLLSAKFARDLHLVRRIRNDFAHNLNGCSFSDSGVQSRVMELKVSSGMAGRDPKFRSTFPSGTKGDCLFEVSWRLWYLHWLCGVIKGMGEAPLEFGYIYPVPPSKPVKTEPESSA